MDSEFMKNYKNDQKFHILKHKNTTSISSKTYASSISRRGNLQDIFEYLLEAAEQKIMLTVYYEIDYSTHNGKYMLKRILTDKANPLERELKIHRSEISDSLRKLIFEQLTDEDIKNSKILQSCRPSNQNKGE